MQLHTATVTDGGQKKTERAGGWSEQAGPEANCDGAKWPSPGIASPLVNQLPLTLATVWEPRDFIRGCHEGIWG